MSDFTQAICEPCWNERYPTRVAHRVNDGEPETCCYCGTDTRCGIYIRVDPNTVPFATLGQP